MNDSVEQFNQEISDAIRYFDKSRVNHIMMPENYPQLTKKQKEGHLCGMTLFNLENDLKKQEFFKYLIFEYKIDEAFYYEYSHPYRNEIVDDLFNIRRLNEQLDQELQINNKNTKKPKV